MKQFLLILLITTTFCSSAQKNITFYKKKFNCKSDTCAINALIEEYKKMRKVNLDSAVLIIHDAYKLAQSTNEKTTLCNAVFYMADAYAYKGDYQVSNSYLDSAIVLADAATLYKKKAEILNLYGINYSDQGLYDSSLVMYNKAREISVKYSFKDMEAKAHTNIGVTYYFLGDLNKAIDYYLKSLKILEELKDSANVSIALSNLSVFFQEKGQLDKALEMLNKAMDYTPEYEQRSRSDIYNNIAVTYTKMKKYKEAIRYYNLSIEMKKVINDDKGMAMSFHNLADVYNKLNDYKNAEICALKAIELIAGRDAPMHEANFLRGLANVYFEMGEVGKGLPYVLKSNEIALQIDNRELIRDNYFLIADMYRSIGDFKRSTDYMFLYQALNDTILKAEFAENIAEMEAKYQNEKNQAEIALLQVDKKNRDLELERQKLTQRLLFIGLAMALLLVIFVTLIYLQKKKANRLLREKNHEIMHQKEEIISQRDEIEAQRDEIITQRDQISHINTEITSSIQYAKRIQKAMLKTEVLLRENVSEYFILFRPRDIVSGDFYWCAKVEGQLVIAVADCTGHGVPGAFMSLLGMSLLKEIVVKEYITKPDIILKRLRREIVSMLGQGSEPGLDMPVRDGMDIAITSLNLATLELQFAGANNPLYLVSGGWPLVSGEVNQQPATSNQQLIELKGDKMPVAIYDKMDPFTLHTIQLQKGDCIYMMSDGMPDQFGGPAGKKFYSKNVRKLLQANAVLHMEEQGIRTETALMQWIADDSGRYEQVDDITLMGIRI